MSNIQSAIPKQNFEIFQDLTAAIITAELGAQATLQTSDAQLQTALQDIKIFNDRFIAIDASEMPAMNIQYFSSDFKNKHVGFSAGENFYNIDVYTSGRAVGSERGDKRSSFLNKRICGIIRAILESPLYYILGTVPGTISRTQVVSIDRDISLEDLYSGSDNISVYRIIFRVDGSETAEMVEPGSLLRELLTTVKIEETELGHQYLYRSSVYSLTVADLNSENFDAIVNAPVLLTVTDLNSENFDLLRDSLVALSVADMSSQYFDMTPEATINVSLTVFEASSEHIDLLSSIGGVEALSVMDMVSDNPSLAVSFGAVVELTVVDLNSEPLNMVISGGGFTSLTLADMISEAIDMSISNAQTIPLTVSDLSSESIDGSISAASNEALSAMDMVSSNPDLSVAQGTLVNLSVADMTSQNFDGSVTEASNIGLTVADLNSESINMGTGLGVNLTVLEMSTETPDMFYQVGVLLIHFMGKGQSQVLGTSSTPRRNHATDPNVLMLGPNTVIDPTELDATINGYNLVTAVENNQENSLDVDTMSVALGRDVLNKIQNENRVCMTICGLGAQSIDNLIRGGSAGTYEKTITIANRVKALADANGWDYMPVCYLMHGGSAGSQYVNKVRILYEDLNQDLPKGTNGEFHFILDQIRQRDFSGSSWYEASAETAKLLFGGQQRPVTQYYRNRNYPVFANDSKIIVSHTRAQVERAGDDIHHTSNGTNHNAALLAETFYRIKDKGETPTPLRLAPPVWDPLNNRLTCSILGHEGQPILGSGNYGISVYNITHTREEAISVTIDSTDPNNPLALIVLDTPLDGNQRILVYGNFSDNVDVETNRYPWSPLDDVARGEMHVSQPVDTEPLFEDTNTPGTKYNLDKYLPRFRHPVNIEVVAGQFAFNNLSLYWGAKSLDVVLEQDGVSKTIYIVGYTTEDAGRTSATVKADAQASGGSFRTTFNNFATPNSDVEQTLTNAIGGQVIAEGTIYFVHVVVEDITTTELEAGYRSINTFVRQNDIIYSSDARGWIKGFRVYVPEGYYKRRDLNLKWGWKVAYHGNGEKAPTNFPTSGEAYNLALLTNFFSGEIAGGTDYEHIVISPQYHEAAPNRDDLYHIIVNECEFNLGLKLEDGGQIMGLSGGGGLPFSFAWKYPERVASIIESSGFTRYDGVSDGNETWALDIADRPKWLWSIPVVIQHNSNDGTVNVGHATDVVNGINALSGSITPPVAAVHIDGSGGHSGWQELAQHLTDFSSVPNATNEEEFYDYHRVNSYSFSGRISEAISVAENTFLDEDKTRAQEILDRNEDLLPPATVLAFQARLDLIIPVPGIDVSPAGPINFGNVNVGQTSPQTQVTITNDGTGPLTITAITLQTNPSSVFSIPIGGAPPASPIQPGGSHILQLTAAPIAAQHYDGVLRIESDAPGEAIVDVDLDVDGVATGVYNPFAEPNGGSPDWHTAFDQSDANPQTDGVAITSLGNRGSGGSLGQIGANPLPLWSNAEQAIEFDDSRALLLQANAADSDDIEVFLMFKISSTSSDDYVFDLGNGHELRILNADKQIRWSGVDTGYIVEVNEWVFISGRLLVGNGSTIRAELEVNDRAAMLTVLADVSGMPTSAGLGVNQAGLANFLIGFIKSGFFRNSVGGRLPQVDQDGIAGEYARDRLGYSTWVWVNFRGGFGADGSAKYGLNVTTVAGSTDVADINDEFGDPSGIGLLIPFADRAGSSQQQGIDTSTNDPILHEAGVAETYLVGATSRDGAFEYQNLNPLGLYDVGFLSNHSSDTTAADITISTDRGFSQTIGSYNPTTRENNTNGEIFVRRVQAGSNGKIRVVYAQGGVAGYANASRIRKVGQLPEPNNWTIQANVGSALAVVSGWTNLDQAAKVTQADDEVVIAGTNIEGTGVTFSYFAVGSVKWGFNTSITSTGSAGFNVDGTWPGLVLRDYVFAQGDNEEVGLRWDGLDPAKAYDLTLVGSRDATGTRTTQHRVPSAYTGGQGELTQSHNVIDNNTSSNVFTDLRPDVGGRIEVFQTSLSGGFNYLNLWILTEKDPI